MSTSNVPALTHDKTRDGLLFALGELKRMALLLAEVSAISAGIDEVRANYELPIDSAQDALSVADVLRRVGQFADAVHARHHAVLFPELLPREKVAA